MQQAYTGQSPSYMNASSFYNATYPAASYPTSNSKLISFLFYLRSKQQHLWRNTNASKFYFEVSSFAHYFFLQRINIITITKLTYSDGLITELMVLSSACLNRALLFLLLYFVCHVEC